MKKFVAMLLAAAMMFSVLVGCGAKEEASVPEDTKANAAQDGFVVEEPTVEAEDAGEEAKEALPTYNIGFLYGQFNTPTGMLFKNSMEYIAAGMNVQFTFIEGGYGEEAIAALEAAAASGEIDAFISATSVSPAFVEAAGGLPIIGVCSEPTAEQAVENATYENYLGSIADDDYAAAYAAAQALYDAGCRRVCLAGLTQGMSASHDDRANAFKAFVEEKEDMELLAEAYSRGLFADDISSFAAAYPEMDGVFSTSGSDAVLNTMNTEGLVGYTKLATIDVSSESGNYFDNGTIAWTCGGQYGTAMIGVAVLYNYLADGTRIIEDPTVSMKRQYVYIHSKEELDDYERLVNGTVPVYTAEELKELIHYYNEDVTYESYVEINKNYTIQDLKTRHGDMVA